MLTCFLALLKSDGVNEFGDLATVLKGFYNPLYRMTTSTPDKDIIYNVVLRTKRPVCLILIDKNNHEDHFKLYFLTNNETNWEKTIYLVKIFGEYAIINTPTTPEKLIKKFEQTKNEYPNPKEVVQPTEIKLSDLMEELDYNNDFETLEAFMKSYQSKQSSPNRFRFGDPTTQRPILRAKRVIQPPIPRGKRVTQKPTGTLLTREERFSAANPFETQARTSRSNLVTPSAPKTPKNRTAKNQTRRRIEL